MRVPKEVNVLVATLHTSAALWLERLDIVASRFGIAIRSAPSSLTKTCRALFTLGPKLYSILYLLVISGATTQLRATATTLVVPL